MPTTQIPADHPLADGLPAGFSFERRGADAYDVPAAWYWNTRTNTRVTVSQEGATEVYVFNNRQAQILQWQARFDAGTPASFILAALETL